jgi:tetratricopeptide (TPR) repeat protein
MAWDRIPSLSWLDRIGILSHEAADRPEDEGSAMATSPGRSFDPRSGTRFSRASSAPSAGQSALVVRLAAEMARRWRAGDRPVTEEFLTRHPELWDQPEEAVDLVYEEICLREEAGQKAAAEEVLARFPQWRGPLERFLECHRMLDPGRAAPRFPEVGDVLGDCRLLAELGRGAQGRVFLATQQALGDRLVVLKLTPCHGHEHLALARLQHTNIVPLYFAWDDPERNLRILGMPYYGGATVARLLERLRDVPPEDRSGPGLLQALDWEAGPAPPPTPEHSPVRHYLERATYVQAVCYLAGLLADALQYAHERGLVHLDVKPSNVLLAADGTPMQLDFHLARPPLRADGPAPEWLGGTPAYMAPEQRAAVHALAEGRPLPGGVGAGADVYALGLLLHEALGGAGPHPAGTAAPRLDRLNPAVSRGLADLVAKCLADDPRRRYDSAADLAGDLRRHALDLPLQGVHNRWGERWQKWRRREPRGLRRAVAAIALLLVAAGVTWVAVRGWRDADAGMKQARAAADYADAVRELHRIATRLRFASADARLPAGAADTDLDARCRSVWERRLAVLDRLGAEPPDEQTAIRTDLLDLGLLWADQPGRRVTPDGASGAGQDASRGPDEVQTLPEPTDPPGRHYALGRSYYQAGDLARADGEFRAALRLDPHCLWSHFYHGICAYRRRQYEEAVLAFTACVALAPAPDQAAQHLYNRARAAAAAGRPEQALADYNLALEYDPGLADAALNRAALKYRAHLYAEALTDLRRAQEGGANPATVCYNRALVQEAQGEHAAALASAEDALRHDPAHAEARRLRDRLRPPP